MTACTEALKPIGNVRAIWTGLARKVLCELAATYNDHPEYEPGWKP